jgi:hypothetical protein
MAWTFDYDKKANVIHILKDGSVFLTQETDTNDGWDKWKSKEDAEKWAKAFVEAHEKEDAERIAAEEAAKKANEDLVKLHEKEAAERLAATEAAEAAKAEEASK